MEGVNLEQKIHDLIIDYETKYGVYVGSIGLRRDVHLTGDTAHLRVSAEIRLLP